MQLLPVSVAAALVTSPPDVGEALCESLPLPGELWRGKTGLWNRWEGQGTQTMSTDPLLSSSSKQHQTSHTNAQHGAFPSQHVFHDTPEQDSMILKGTTFILQQKTEWDGINPPPFSRQSVDLMAAVSSWVVALLCLLPEMRLGEQLSLGYGKAFSSLFCLI